MFYKINDDVREDDDGDDEGDGEDDDDDDDGGDDDDDDADASFFSFCFLSYCLHLYRSDKTFLQNQGRLMVCKTPSQYHSK